MPTVAVVFENFTELSETVTVIDVVPASAPAAKTAAAAAVSPRLRRETRELTQSR